MQAFIRGIGLIAPQPVFGRRGFPDHFLEHNELWLRAVEPDYREHIRPLQLRRMSRILRMGVTSAMQAMQDAGTGHPDAIITATGIGMMEETEKFLNAILDNGERMLNPTAFIQSTHNTVGAHIAVMLGCNNYNTTYVHGPVSFESALLDSLMCLAERPGDNVLTGGVEEMTQEHFRITDSVGYWKKEPVSNFRLLEQGGPGTLAGEGAAFFVLTNRPDPGNYARVLDVQTLYRPQAGTGISEALKRFLERNRLGGGDIDIVLTGMNGDQENDRVYAEFEGELDKSKFAHYKHLCGEHYLASSFALWMAATAIRNGNFPAVAMTMPGKEAPGRIRNMLLYNHYKGIHHAFILVSAC
jgi:3-oxoacyl-(acyl-carrier-protein) synthase